MDEKENGISLMLDAMEAKFQEFDVKLADIEQMVDGAQKESDSSKQADISEPADKPAIEDELAGYRQAVEELQAIRQEIHRLYVSDERDEEARNLKIMYEMLDLLKAVQGQSEELSRQCSYLQEAKDSLAEIGNSEKLAGLMDVLKVRMESLGDCNAKIKEAADMAMDRVSTMEEILEKRLVDVNDMEKEVLTSSHVLRQTAENIDAVVREAGNDGTQLLRESLDKMNQELVAKVSNMDSVMQDLVAATRSNTDRTDDMVKASQEHQDLLEENQSLKKQLEIINGMVNSPEIQNLHRQWGIDGRDLANLSDAGKNTMLDLYKTYKMHDKLVQEIKNLVN